MRRACKRYRAGLVAGRHTSRHADSCPACRQFQLAWSQLDAGLRQRSVVEAPPGFGQRVRARLPEQDHPVVTMALRTLPAMLALVAALTLWLATQSLREQPAAGPASVGPCVTPCEWRGAGAPDPLPRPTPPPGQPAPGPAPQPRPTVP